MTERAGGRATFFSVGLAILELPSLGIHKWSNDGAIMCIPDHLASNVPSMPSLHVLMRNPALQKDFMMSNEMNTAAES